MRLHFLAVPVAALCLSVAAHAGSFSFAMYGSGIDGAFTIQVAPTGDPAIYEITGISGTFSSVGPYDTSGHPTYTPPSSISGAITGLRAGSYSSANPTIASGGVFDNLFYPTGAHAVCYFKATNQIFDNCGIEFIVGNFYQVNLWGDGAGGFQLTDTDLTGGPYLDDNAQVTLVATPEPSGLVFVGTGVLGVLGAVRRKFRSA
jgi:hypothetical protein